MSETFDQMRRDLQQGSLFDPQQTAPHVAIPATLVLEPNSHQGVSRVRVTARDKNFNVLWGANVSEGMLDPESATEVAFYSTLRQLIREHLPQGRLRFETTGDPYESIQCSVAVMRELCSAIEADTVGVKNKSDVTFARAEAAADLLLDTIRTWTQTLRDVGVSQKCEPAGDGTRQ